MTLQKEFRIAEGQSQALRFESFDVFNHAQFYGPASVDGQIEDFNFERIASAETPRLVQLATRFAS